MTDAQAATQKHYGDALKLELFDSIFSALKQLHRETRDYIIINNLGDAHQNQSMKNARDALTNAAPAIAADAAYANFQRKNPTYDFPKTAATGIPIG